MSPEMQAELNRKVKLGLSMQSQITAYLDQIEKIIKTMREDIKVGSMPRYHGHLLSETIKLNETAIRINALNQ